MTVQEMDQNAKQAEGALLHLKSDLSQALGALAQCRENLSAARAQYNSVYSIQTGGMEDDQRARIAQLQAQAAQIVHQAEAAVSSCETQVSSLNSQIEQVSSRLHQYINDYESVKSEINHRIGIYNTSIGKLNSLKSNRYGKQFAVPASMSEEKKRKAQKLYEYCNQRISSIRSTLSQSAGGGDERDVRERSLF